MNIGIFAVKNRLITTLVIIGALYSGWFAYENMARFEDPEFTIRTAVVVTPYPGATPEEVANEVTDPLETAIQQLQEVKEIKSVSSAGQSYIEVDILYKFSPNKASLQSIWSKLRNKVADAQSQLPPNAMASIVNDDFGDVYGVFYLITGDGFNYNELKEYGKSLRTSLLTVDGVAKVKLSGVQDEAIYVEISRERIATLGLAVNSIIQDLSKQNAVVSAGNLQIGDNRLVIQPSGSIDSVESLRNLIVSSDGEGTLVYLKDIANVYRDYVDPSSFEVRYNGKPAIGLGISNVTGANVVAMGNAIDSKLRDIDNQRPYGIELHEFYNQGKVTDDAVMNFALNVVAALGIVLVTLFFFMGLKSAVIIGAVLVITIAATLTTMYMVDIPMHRISLGALIIALGMLVDNAIVVTEGILVGTQKGEDKLAVTKRVVERSIWPLLGGTLVGIIAFAPIGFAPGNTAEYTGHLFWVVMISLMYSWIFAVTIVPFLADLLFKTASNANVQTSDGKVLALYKGFLRGVLKVKWVPIGVAAGLFALSVYSFQYVKAGFFPSSTTPQIVVDFWLPEGTDISKTKQELLSVEQHLLQLEGIEAVQTLVGAGALRYMLIYPPESNNTSYGQFLVRTESYQQIAELLPTIQQYIDQRYPEVQSKVWQFQLGPGGGSKIEAEFSGPNPAVLRKLAESAKAILVEDGGAVSVKDDWRQPVAVVQPEYSEVVGRRLGISR